MNKYKRKQQRNMSTRQNMKRYRNRNGNPKQNKMEQSDSEEARKFNGNITYTQIATLNACNKNNRLKYKEIKPNQTRHTNY